MSITSQPLLESAVAADKSVAGMLLTTAATHASSGIRFVLAQQIEDAEFLSYRAVLEEARHILGGLHATGRPTGSKIALLLDRPRDFIPAFWACILGGYIPCALAPIQNDAERWAKHLSHVDTLLDGPLFVSSGRLLTELPATTASVALSELRAAPRWEEVHEAGGSEAAILMLTSGSTGNSKAVELTHDNLYASMAGRAERQGLTAADTMLNWIAFDHVAALLESHMIALFVGAEQVHAEPAVVLADPLQFLRFIDRYRVTVAFAPNFLLGKIAAAVQVPNPEIIRTGASKLNLSRLRRIVTGGEANVVETGVRFLECLSPYGIQPHVLWPAFGMTETCAACVYSHEFPHVDQNREFAAIGLPIGGLEVRIVNDQGEPCLGGEAGELQLRGPMIFRRYYNNEEATRTAFTLDGWFRTGDIGRIEEGRLSLIARNKDSIIVSGVNYYSQELETKIEPLKGIERSFIAAFPFRPKGADTEQLVVAFASELAPEQEAELHQVIVAIRNTTILLWGFRPSVVLPLPAEAFPKTSLGKIQRSLMRRRFEAGEYAPYVERVAALSSRQVGPRIAPQGSEEEAIAGVFAGILGISRDVLGATESFFDLGGTSLDILKLTRAIERQFRTRIGLPVVLQNPSVRQLASYLSRGSRPGEYDPVVPLQVNGRKVPLFCIHPGNGEIFILTNLAKYFLNDRPFLALRPQGFNEGEKCFQSFDQMVESYVDAILRHQAQGPYAIAGYSLGCQIAFEVTRRIEQRGHTVGFFGCIDYWPSVATTQLSFNMATGLALVIDLINFDQFEALNRELPPELPSDEVCDRVLALASQERLAELDLDRQRFATWSRVAHSVETLVFAHQNTGNVKSATIFCSEGMSQRYTPVQWNRRKWREELGQWDSFALSRKYIEVSGDHHALMGPKHVAAFQAQLRSEIDAALGGL
jgi:acyl-CoA synthetase (AMP-forming)/AMP-acid ligase II/thioesterase domain-containing protein/acyl carrier protein